MNNKSNDRSINQTNSQTNGQTKSSMVFRFPYFDSSHEMKKLKLEEEKANIAKIIAQNPKTFDIQVGRNILPDQTAFNKMFDTVLNVNRYQRNIKKKIKYLPLNDKPLDYTKLTIEQLKTALYVDFFDMCNELLLIEKINFESFNRILSKNYRKVTILCFILVVCLISYIIINILDDKK
jgi:hypothetical protein